MPTTETYDEVEAELYLSHQEHPPAQFQGRCPACGRSILVRNGSGRLWHHGPNNQYRCKGSGAEPVQGTREPRTRAAFH
jgi:competence CoiA-like predicted nuclease